MTAQQRNRERDDEPSVEERFAQRAGIPWNGVEDGGDGSAWYWYHPSGRWFAAINERGVSWYRQYLDSDGYCYATRNCRAPRGYRSV
jgi:hypothetical protein